MSIAHSQCSIAARASSEDHRLFNKTVKSTEGISDKARKCARNDWLHRIANATFVLFFFLVFFSPPPLPSSMLSSIVVVEEEEEKKLMFPNKKSRICATCARKSILSFASAFK